MSKQISNYPKEEAADRGFELMRAIAKAAAGVLNPLFPELVEFLFRRPIEQRRDEWFVELQSAIQELTDKVEGFTPAKLAESDEFITVLHKATDIALRTHQKEKRKLLRNAIVSSGQPTSFDLDKQIFFLRLVDELTINQVLVLNFYRDPLGWFKRHNKKPQEFPMASRIEALHYAYPQFYENPDAKELLLSELNRIGLLPGLGGMVLGNAVYNPMTSKLGCEFLDFVKGGSLEL